jgi:hypothetical protein
MNQNNEPPRITYDSDEFRRRTSPLQTATPTIIRWVMKYSGGRIKEKQAEYVLIGFVALSVIISFLLIASLPDSPQPASPEELRSFGKIQ